MSDDERTILLLGDAVRNNETTIRIMSERVDILQATVLRLTDLADVMVAKQEDMKEELATLRMYVANGWSS